MKIKSVFILLIIISSMDDLRAQLISDYFIPSGKIVKHGFVNKNGNIEKEMSKIYQFTTKQDRSEMAEVILFKGNVMSSSVKILAIKDSTIAVTTETITDAFSSKPTIVFHNNTILLKLPKEGETAKWTNPGKKSRMSGKVDPPTNHTASWTTIDFDGEKRKAIKVIAITDLRDEKFEQVSYYIQDIGLYRVDGVNKGIPFTIHKFIEFE